MSTARENFELAQQRYAATFERHLDNGVNFISDNVCIEPEVVIAPGATILPGCILRGQTVIGPDCVIGPNTLLEDTVVDAGSTINASQCYGSHIGPNNKIGPFTHVRVGTKTAEGCHLGAYVETKNADFAEGNTVSHLTYIGDATVGKYCNFGCGTVTCNYDGEGKFHTTIGDYAFIGCNTNLVAPVTIGDHAFTAAGSTIGHDVPAGALGIERAKQAEIDGWGARMGEIYSPITPTRDGDNKGIYRVAGGGARAAPRPSHKQPLILRCRAGHARPLRYFTIFQRIYLCSK